jgi:DNA-binding GntR family transcriptional regulator
MPADEPADDIALFRRRAAELARRQLIGELPPPGRISQDQLAAGLGLSRHQLRELERRALLKLRRALSAGSDLI